MSENWGNRIFWACIAVLLVLLLADLETGEGACFSPGGSPVADLRKHRVWVCPMFEPFLEWLYLQDLTDIDTLPGYVELPDAEFLMAGHRRKGPDEAQVAQQEA